MTHMERKKAIQNAITIFDKIIIGDYNGTRAVLRKILLEMKANDTEEFAASQYVMRRLLFYFDLYPRSTYAGNSYLKFSPPTRIAINLWKTHIMALDYLGVTEDGRILENKETKSFKDMGKSMISGTISSGRTAQIFHEVNRTKWIHLMGELVDCLESIADGTYYEKVREMIYERNAILDIWKNKELETYTSHVFRDSKNRRITNFYAFCIYTRKMLREIRVIDENGMNVTPDSDVFSLNIDMDIPKNAIPDSGTYRGARRNLWFYSDRNSRMHLVKNNEEHERKKKRSEVNKEEVQEDMGFTQEKLDEWIDKYNREHHLGEYHDPIDNGCYIIYDFMLSATLFHKLKKFAFITKDMSNNFLIIGNCIGNGSYILRFRKVSAPSVFYDNTYDECDVISYIKYILNNRSQGHIYIQVREGIKLNINKNTIKGITPVPSEKAKFLPVVADLSCGNFFQYFDDGLFEAFLDDLNNWRKDVEITEDEVTTVETVEEEEEEETMNNTTNVLPYVEPWKKMTLEDFLNCEVFYPMKHTAGLKFTAVDDSDVRFAQILIDGVSDRNPQKKEFSDMIHYMMRNPTMSFNDAASCLEISISDVTVYVDYCIQATRERVENLMLMMKLIKIGDED